MSEHVVGDYQLLNCIAAGSQTQIWEVGHPGGPERYVMKLMLPHVFQDKEAVRSLRHEARVGTSLEHPNLIEFHQFSMTGSEAFIVMEYFRGPNLKNSLKADPEGLQARLRRVMEGACLALAELHRHGWVHKDVKPDNILSNRAGEVKVIDFALATRVPSGLGKLFGGKVKSIQGTRTYIAPETIRKRHATPATDVYSLGVTLYELVAGTPPFKGSSPNDLLKRHLAEKPDPPSVYNPNVTSELDQLVTWMLAKKPENRPGSMDELYQAIRTVPMFREAIVPGAAAKREEEADLESVGRQLDSRADAKRTAARGTVRAPAQPAAQSSKPAAPTPPPQAAPSRPPAPPQPQQPYPQQPYPPQPYPQQAPQPQQPYPYPQQPYPQQPYPPQPYPQQPYPQQGQPQQAQPPQPPAESEAPPVRRPPNELPPMTELPDVI